jgi:hypothetical protein
VHAPRRVEVAKAEAEIGLAREVDQLAELQGSPNRQRVPGMLPGRARLRLRIQHDEIAQRLQAERTQRIRGREPGRTRTDHRDIDAAGGWHAGS